MKLWPWRGRRAAREQELNREIRPKGRQGNPIAKKGPKGRSDPGRVAPPGASGVGASCSPPTRHLLAAGG